MSAGSRKIDDILKFRSDISPFLVHLTRKEERADGKTASEKLTSILQQKTLRSLSLISDAQFRISREDAGPEKFFKAVGAVCFTETPLNEIHCLLEIEKRNTNLEPYGLVFLKEKLIKKGVSPVIYINNMNGDKEDLIQALCLIYVSSKDSGPTANGPKAIGEQLLPLISVFGKKLTPLGYQSQFKEPEEEDINSLWEREWRYPAAMGAFKFGPEDIFVGLCPDDEISSFEKILPKVKFVDPMRNMKWYAEKLIDARQRCNLKVSVV